MFMMCHRICRQKRHSNKLTYDINNNNINNMSPDGGLAVQRGSAEGGQRGRREDLQPKNGGPSGQRRGRHGEGELRQLQQGEPKV